MKFRWQSSVAVLAVSTVLGAVAAVSTVAHMVLKEHFDPSTNVLVTVGDGFTAALAAMGILIGNVLQGLEKKECARWRRNSLVSRVLT